MIVVPRTADLSILCCVYPGEAHETYRRSLIIDVVWYSLGLISTASNAQGQTAGGIAVSVIMLVWAAILLFNAPNMARPLSEGTKTAAFFYGWVKLIMGWILVVLAGVLILFGILAFGAGSQASKSDQTSGAIAGAIGVALIIFGIILIPVAIIIIQTAKNILGALNAMGSPAYFQPANPGNYSPAPGYGAPAPGYGAPAPGYGAPAPGYGAPAPGYGAPAPAFPGPMYGGAPQPQPGFAPNQPQYV